MSSALTRLRRITVGARDDADADALGLEMARSSQCWQLGDETVEIVLVEDPAGVQGAFERIKGAFAEVGTAGAHGEFECESGLKASFYKTSELAPRYRMEFVGRDGVAYKAGVRDEEAAKNAKRDVESYFVRKDGRLYLAHTGGFHSGGKVEFRDFADKEGLERVRVDGKQMVLITQIEAISFGSIVNNIDRYVGLKSKFEATEINPFQAPKGESEIDFQNFESLANELRLEVPFFQEIWTLLEDKRQIIFQGPPGTGKTYVAQRLAEHLAGSSDRVTIVQFHPSYAYEDFVQGFRPTLDEKGGAGFVLTDGPLLTAANAARCEPDERHFLIIDEITAAIWRRCLASSIFCLSIEIR